MDKLRYKLAHTFVAPVEHGRIVVVADVGMLHVYWTGPDDERSAWTGSGTAVDGFPNRGDLLERYAKVSGRDVGAIDFYVAFAFWKLACILEGVYSRYLGGALGDVDREHVATFRVQVERASGLAERYVERLA